MSTATSTEILPYNAPRHLWLAERRNGIGGSDASKVCGVSGYGGTMSVYLDKLGQLPDVVENEAMEWGKRHEPAMRLKFTDDTGIGIHLAGLQRNTERPWQQHTPDGFTDDGGLFEGKTTNGWLEEEWENGQTADHAEIQVQHGMGVTGRSHAWVAVLIDGRHWELRRVERDDEQIEMITELEREFWFENVLAKVPPAPLGADLDVVKDLYRGALDPDKITMATPEEAEAAIRKWQEAKAAVAAAESAEAEAEARLRMLVGEGHALKSIDKVLLTAKPTGTFAASRFVADHPDLAEHLSVPTTKLDIDLLKAAHPDIYNQYRSRVLRLTKDGKAAITTK